MPSFSPHSLELLSTCHPDLQKVLKEAIKHADFVVLEGHRGETAQNIAFANGTSQKKWPEGNHNSLPSKAVDIAPYPIDWKDKPRFIRLLSFVQGLGFGMGIPLRLGGDWDSDFLFDEHFFDWPHIELA